MTAPRKGGRRSKRDEIADFIEKAGLDPNLIELADLPAPRKEPERITDTDVESALGDTVDLDDPTIQKIHEKVTEWVYSMLVNHPDKLPPTFAIKLFLDLEKAKAAQTLAPDDTGVEVSILDRIDALPPAHAAELLKREIELLDTRRAEYFAVLERLLEAE